MIAVTRSTKSRIVNFYDRVDDHECALYGAMGFSTQFIVRKTGLTPSQITYRLKKAGLTKENGTSRTDFRNGTSPFVSAIVNSSQKIIDAQLIRFLKTKLR